ncbi:hypothetical protein [Stetteria hydrogenophila]
MPQVAEPRVRGHVAVAGALGTLTGLALALLTLHGPLASLDARLRGVTGLAVGFIVYALWYSASALTGGAARFMRLAEILESLAAFYLAMLPAWVGFYNAFTR